VIELTEAQTWTTIGVLSVALLGTLTLVTNVLTRTINTQIGSLRNEMTTQFGALRAEMSARFETVDVRLNSLDRDMQAVANRVFGTESP
jgi:hypothetical protein